MLPFGEGWGVWALWIIAGGLAVAYGFLHG